MDIIWPTCPAPASPASRSEERERWAELADGALPERPRETGAAPGRRRVPDAAADREMRDYLEQTRRADARRGDQVGQARPGERARRAGGSRPSTATVLPVSAESGEGIEELRREIRRRLEEVEE